MMCLNTADGIKKSKIATFNIMEKKINWRLKLGIVIMAISVLLFLFLPVIPFLSIDNNTKITISTIVFITAEVTFYGGGFLVGKELFSKYKSYLNPKNWFKKKQEEHKKVDL